MFSRDATILLVERDGFHQIVFRDPALVLAKRMPERGATIESLRVSATSRGILLKQAQAEAKRRKVSFRDETA